MCVCVCVCVHLDSILYPEIFCNRFFRKLATYQTTRRHVIKFHFLNHIIRLLLSCTDTSPQFALRYGHTPSKATSPQTVV